METTAVDLTDQDREQLRLLVIFHWVAAALAAGFALITVLQLALFASMGDGMHWILLPWILLFVGTIVLGACLALAAGAIAERRKRTFCIVVAAFACVFAPIGTLLGVFTIYVLTKPAIAARFDAGGGARRGRIGRRSY